MSTVRADFDRIAQLSPDGWDHNSHYHHFLLSQLPSRCANALDIGCGTGAFSRLLADRSDRVLGLDLSPHMIQVARERSRQYSNIDFLVADAAAWEFPAQQFDCVVSIATLHHLPAAEMLHKMGQALKMGGTLTILDLFQGQGLADLLTSVAAVPVSAVLRLAKTGRLRQFRQLREAWAEHGRHESHLTMAQVRQICDSVLPGASVRKHLLWRYSVTWQKAALVSHHP